MEAINFVCGLLVLVLMLYEVTGTISATCDKDRQMKDHSVTCSCNTNSGQDITWAKDDALPFTTCLNLTGECFPEPPQYNFSYSILSGSMKSFVIKFSSSYTSCGKYTCNDGTSASKSIELSDYDSSLAPSWTEPDDVKQVSITSSCFYKEADFTANWYIDNVADSASGWIHFTEVSNLMSDNSTCTNTCSAKKAEKITAMFPFEKLPLPANQPPIDAKLGVQLVHHYYPSDKLPIWSSTRTYTIPNCCIRPGDEFLVICGVAVTCMSLLIILVIILIIVGPKGKVVVLNLSRLDIAAASLDIVVFLYSLIVGAYTVANNGECRNCITCLYGKCDTCLSLGIASIVLAITDVFVLIVFIIIRNGWCGKRLTCLNTVLPVCKDTEARGPPDGKSDNPAAKEKHREVKLLTHKEQTQQHHRETVVNKGKPSGEKHEEPSKGQPRPLPVPTGNNRDDTGSAGAVSRQDVVLDRRPMPEIPSDRHKRGLSANFNDDHDKPLDDNIVHTLPVVKKPKTALDPMNAEDQSKNSDDQPKKKKKKKKDRDTSRSEEMEDGY